MAAEGLPGHSQISPLKTNTRLYGTALEHSETTAKWLVEITLLLHNI